MFLCWVLLSVSRARPVALKHAPPRLPTSKRSQTCRAWQHVHLLAIVTLVVAHHEFPGSHEFFGPAIKTLPNLPGVAACAPARNCDTRRGAPRIYRVARVFRARHQSSKFVWVAACRPPIASNQTQTWLMWATQLADRGRSGHWHSNRLSQSRATATGNPASP